MLAVQLTRWGAAPELREVPVPRPAGREVLLRVTAAGLCRSDLHVMDSSGAVFGYPLPLTLGHEVAGIVTEVGPEADAALVGQAVVVHGIWSCGACRNCLRGRENYCLTLRPGPDGRLVPLGNGLGHPGGLAEFLLVPDGRHLVPAPGLAPEHAAPLADAGATAVHAVRENLDLIDAATVAVVIGVGGLGHLAVQILRADGVRRIVAVDTRAEARELALALGAESAVAELSAVRLGPADAHPAPADTGPPSAGAARTSAQAEDPAPSLDGGADLILDFAGVPQTVGPALELLAPGGRLVQVGSGGGRAEVGKDLGLAPGWRVSAPFWATRADLAHAVRLATEGALHTSVETFPLADAPAVYARLRAGEITGRAVLVP
ncbi:NAD(P)-dependent alcohol dehydrogenase [Nocardia sp. NPDC057353]|uniref:NAD(P)-dependent alcohol dehydrogenase n=1 Tax=Nocardia sp. NPDC057353 TaxID=3346104 RepID=UPI00362B3D2F